MKLIQAIESLTRWAGWVGAILIFPLVGALVVEVFSRYVAGRPTLWAFEISYMVMGAIFMLGMANALRIGHHVSVDLVSFADYWLCAVFAHFSLASVGAFSLCIRSL
jgi:TRAP-type mannitol/chloroaromatic compound transport system permease small subunit